MKKLINTLLYGDRRTKGYLWSLILLVLAALACGVMFMVTIRFWWILGTLAGLIAAAVIGNSVVFREAGEREQPAGDRAAVQKLPENKKDRSTRDRAGKGQSTAGKAEENIKRNIKQNMEQDEDSGDDKDDVTYLQDMEEKQLKKYFVTYKVKKIHYPVLIDSCESENIFECPAYIWTDKGRLHFLVLEKKPREFSIPVSRATVISYEKAAHANPVTEYAAIRVGGMIGRIFEELLPACYDVMDRGRRSTRKNLYVIGEDIMITAASAKAAFTLLKAEFELPNRFNPLFRGGTYAGEAYKNKILWRDGVISTAEFKARSKALLQQMTEAAISDAEFTTNMEQMLERQLVTQEYAEYYMKERVSAKGGRT